MRSSSKSSANTILSTNASRSKLTVTIILMILVESASRMQELEERANRAEKDNSLLKDQALCF